ncbi:MAG: CaiB/BaiF CoA-transferase family protein [Comamonadaceae bacterium]|nr:CaiB/BaiF CoA-transferase family protein [Comamonadaceae bacterium]
MNTPLKSNALTGIRVLDFSIMMAGPYCTRLLAELGADVIKIEPLEGDDMRLREPRREGRSAYFGQLNAGKRSVAMDLKRPEAVALIKQLVQHVDVVVENFRPGAMERLGLDAGTLLNINPRLIYCSISGYGQTGASADQAAYAMIVHAESGFDRTVMRYAGDREHPAHAAVFVADMLGAIFAFGAIQAALIQRTSTNKGQTIDVALMDCMLNLLVYELQEAQFPVTSPRPTYGPVRAADGDLIVAPITSRNFDALCTATEQRKLREDPRFATMVERNANWDAMMRLVESWTSKRSQKECIDCLRAAGVPCAPYNEPGDALKNPTLLERGLFSKIEDAAGSFTGINPPWKMSGIQEVTSNQVPEIGEHTHIVLKEMLGLSTKDFQDLQSAGVLGR